MNKIIEKAFPQGSSINRSNPEIQINEVFHQHDDNPLSFIFSISDETGKFHAELLQTFSDDNSVWVITEYFDEIGDTLRDNTKALRIATLDLISRKDHIIAIADSDYKVLSIDFRVKGSYPYSVFGVLYSS